LLMFGERFTAPFAGRSARVFTLAVVLWIALWIGFAVAISLDVRNLRSLGDTVSSSGRALGQTAQALRQLGSLPFVGPRIARVADQIEEVARSAESSGAESRSSATSLSILLGIAVALIPTIPILALYLPLRRSAVKDVRAVRRSLAQQSGDPMFEEFLARRAAQTLPFHQLREVSENPWSYIAEARTKARADLELKRLGLRRPRTEPGAVNGWPARTT